LGRPNPAINSESSPRTIQNFYGSGSSQLVPWQPNFNVSGTFDDYKLAGVIAGLSVVLGGMALYGVDLYVRTTEAENKNTPEEGDYYAPVPPTFDASALSGNFLTPDFNPDSILNLPGSIINSVTGGGSPSSSYDAPGNPTGYAAPAVTPAPSEPSAGFFLPPDDGYLPPSSTGLSAPTYNLVRRNGHLSSSGRRPKYYSPPQSYQRYSQRRYRRDADVRDSLCSPIPCLNLIDGSMVFEDDQNHRKGKGEEDGSDTDNTDNESQADDKIDLDSELAASNSTSFDPVGTVVGWGTGVANFVTNAVDTVYALPDIYNGLSEAWTEERCYERIMCETYDRTSEHWLWEYIVPIFEPMYPSFYRARNVARSTVKCEGFYSECVNLDRVYRWRDGRL